ncbi:MAG: CPBP family intramembrane metalloprotease [Candidatus Obscuribacterales bacterium]|nr:CPBP family intramembrane metalloprotease [Candidatus Obscuribacterales bacterium]
MIPEPPSLSRASLMSITLVLEGVLLLIATVWSWCADLALLPELKFTGFACVVGIMSACCTVLASLLCYRLGEFMPFFRELRELSDNVLVPMVRHFAMFDIILVSLTSGVCEEVLFRGVMLPQWGIIASSIIFGLVHSPTLKYLPYVVVTILAGFLFGALYEYTGSLWTPIVAHIVHNFVSLSVIRVRITSAGDAS